MVISALIAIGLPVALFVIFHQRTGAAFLPLLAGASGFVVFALVLEQVVHRIVLGRFALAQHPVLYVLYGALMAGIFEETARFLVFHILKWRNLNRSKGERSLGDRSLSGSISTALAYGVGHGGIEAILLVALPMINSVMTAALINSGAILSSLAALEGQALDQANAQIAALATAAPALFLVSGVERIFAIGVHLSLSVLVFYAVNATGRWWLYPLAIALHALVDVPALLFQTGVIDGVLITEVIVALCCAFLLCLAWYTHKKLRGPAASAVPAE
jgi:uncharacterized membrane protein YhfC